MGVESGYCFIIYFYTRVSFASILGICEDMEWVIYYSKGCWIDSWLLHAKESLGKILDLQVASDASTGMSQSTYAYIIWMHHTLYECVCDWVNDNCSRNLFRSSAG